MSFVNTKNRSACYKIQQKTRRVVRRSIESKTSQTGETDDVLSLLTDNRTSRAFSSVQQFLSLSLFKLAVGQRRTDV